MNILDTDDTHDRLFAQKIKPAILALLTNALSTKGIFDNPFPIALIERIAPGALNPWAEDWTGKMFKFLKKLSLTHILDDGYLNGSVYGFEPEYTADLPDLIDLEEYHTDKITVRIPSGATGILTWLERTHDEQSAPYCSKLTNKLTIAMRRSRLFKNTAGQPLEIEVFTKNWLHNSACFQGIELVGVTANQADFLLYQNIDNFLDYLWGLLDISTCKVLTGMTAKVAATGRWISPNNVTSAIDSVEAIDPIFATVPSDYHYCYLQKTSGAEQGNNTVIFHKVTESLDIEIGYNYPFFQAWEDTLTEPNPRGYELNQDPFTNKDYTVLNYPCLFPNAPIDFRTYKNNQNLDAVWQVPQFIDKTSYPPLSRAQFVAKNGNAWECRFNLTPTLDGDKDGLSTHRSGASAGFVFYQESETNFEEWAAIFPDYPGAWGGPYVPEQGVSQGHNQKSKSFYTKGIDSVAVGLLADDHNLFSSGEVALIQCQLNFLDEFFLQYEMGFGDDFHEDHYNLGNCDSYWNIKVYRRNLSAKLKLTANNAYSEPQILESLAWNELQQIAEFQTLPFTTDWGQELTFPPGVTDPITIENTVTLRREFR
jgi:hypothetical protein